MKSLTEQLDCAMRLVTARRIQKTKAEGLNWIARQKADYELDCAESIVATLQSLREQQRSNEPMRPEREF